MKKKKEDQRLVEVFMLFDEVLGVADDSKWHWFHSPDCNSCLWEEGSRAQAVVTKHGWINDNAR